MWFWRRQHPQLNFKSKGEVGTQIFDHLRFQVFTSTQIDICSLLTSIQKLPVEVIGLMQKSDVQNWSCLVARWFFGPNHFESSFGWVNQRRKGFCWVLQTFRSRLRPSTRSTFWVCHLLRIVASAPKNPRKKVWVFFPEPSAFSTYATCFGTLNTSPSSSMICIPCKKQILRSWSTGHRLPGGVAQDALGRKWESLWRVQDWVIRVWCSEIRKSTMAIVDTKDICKQPCCSTMTMGRVMVVEWASQKTHL